MTGIITADTALTGHASISQLAPLGSVGHRVARVAAGISSAAHDAGIELTLDYANTVAAQGISRCDQLGVTKFGAGVVIHTVPEGAQEHPVVLGYADGTGQWLRDDTFDGSGQGGRH